MLRGRNEQSDRSKKFNKNIRHGRKAVRALKSVDLDVYKSELLLLPGASGSGKVVKIGQILGRKNFRTERPTEKIDTKILEVLIGLAPGQKLPLGLRVDAFISGE